MSIVFTAIVDKSSKELDWLNSLGFEVSGVGGSASIEVEIPTELNWSFATENSADTTTLEVSRKTIFKDDKGRMRLIENEGKLHFVRRIGFFKYLPTSTVLTPVDNSTVTMWWFLGEPASSFEVHEGGIIFELLRWHPDLEDPLKYWENCDIAGDIESIKKTYWKSCWRDGKSS